MSVLAARFDPLGIQIATSLPTYLGARELAQDVRTKTNLTQAMAAMEEYRVEHGSYGRADHRGLEDHRAVVARSGSRSVFCATPAPA